MKSKMKSNQKAILRLSCISIKSIEHPRLILLDTIDFPPNGSLVLNFDHESSSYVFCVPFNRPVLREGYYSNLITLNQGPLANAEFHKFQRTASSDYLLEVKIACEYELLLNN